MISPRFHPGTFFLWLLAVPFFSLAQQAPGGLYIDPQTPQYWSYQGKPLMLIGGSSDDNLFQHPEVSQELDLIQAAGGNYVRCTLSSRDSGNVWAFKREGEKYDLTQFNTEYWNRLDHFFSETAARDIIVQVEVWATFDFYRENWLKNPFNPRNDKNPQAWRIRLPEEVPTHPIARENPFFWSVPLADNNPALLTKQQAFVDKLLSISLRYDHILYCIDNETSVTAQWPLFWAKYIKTQAQLAGKEVYVTEMWDAHELDHPDHLFTIQHPEVFDFIDISQNNHQTGQKHFDNGVAFKKKVYQLRSPCPLNNVKVYGKEQHGSPTDGLERFWRAAFLGSASVRFHRPNSGHGISLLAQKHIQSLRWVFDALDFPRITPLDNELKERQADEAYGLKDTQGNVALYFPRQGSLQLSDPGLKGNYRLRWLDIDAATWHPDQSLSLSGTLNLETPTDQRWAALLIAEP